MATATQGALNQRPLPEGDPPQQSSKRPLPAAEAAESTRNPKMQRVDYRSEPVHLDHIVILANGPKSMGTRSSLNMFGSRDFPNQLCPHHYSYEALRDWLWEAVGIDRSAPLILVYLDESGEKRHAMVANDHQFNAALVSVKNGAYAPLKGDVGPYFGLCPKMTERSATKSPQPQKVKSQQCETSDGAEPVLPQPAAAAIMAKSTAPATATPATWLPQPPTVQNHESGHGDVAKPVQAQPTATATVASSAAPATSLSPEQTPVDKQGGPIDAINISSDSDSDDDDDDGEGHGDDPANTGCQEPNIREPRLDDFDISTLRRALQFFQTTEGPDGKCVVSGCRIAFHWYHIYRVFRMLISPTETGINGMMIDWGTGYGKTLLAWLYLRVRARLASRWTKVEYEWQEPPAESKRRHLPKSGQVKGAICPSQTNCIVVCPCVAGSDSRLMCETYLTDTPALVIMPPGLGPVWLSDLRKAFIKRRSGRIPVLNIYTYMTDAKADNNMALSTSNDKRINREDIISNTAGNIAVGVIMQGEEYFERLHSVIREGIGSAHDVFLASESTLSQLIKLYPNLEGEQHTSHLTIGVAFMGKFHKYEGMDAKRDTIPFTLLKNIQAGACHSVSLFTMSGTTIDKGPPAWRAAVEHYISQWARHPEQLSHREGLAPDETLRQFHDIRKKYNQLLRDLSTSAISDVDARATAKEIRAFLSTFVTTLRRGQIYRGQAINKLPAMTEKLVDLQPRMDDSTAAALKGFITSVNTLIEKKLEAAVSQWRDNKRKAEADEVAFADCEPTSQSIMAGLVSDEIKAIDIAFTFLQRSSMYPYLSVLLTHGDKNYSAAEFAKATGSKESQEAAVACQRLLLQEKPKPLKEALKKFSNWKFAKYRHEIVANSVKYEAIRGLIMEMIADKNPDITSLDESGQRQAIIFCSHDISASITYYLMLTDPALKDIMEPLLIFSDMKTSERQSIINYFNDLSLLQSRSKVLIAMLPVTAEGFNIQGANNIWFAELPITFTKQEQGKCRAHIQGQGMNVRVVKFQEEGNLMELYGYQMMGARNRLQELIYDVAMA